MNTRREITDMKVIDFGLNTVLVRGRRRPIEHTHHFVIEPAAERSSSKGTCACGDTRVFANAVHCPRRKENTIDGNKSVGRTGNGAFKKEDTTTMAKKSAKKTTKAVQSKVASLSGFKALQRSLGLEPTGILSDVEGQAISQAVEAAGMKRLDVALKLGWNHFLPVDHFGRIVARGHQPLSQKQAEALAGWITEQRASAKRAHKAIKAEHVAPVTESQGEAAPGQPSGEAQADVSPQGVAEAGPTGQASDAGLTGATENAGPTA